MKKSINHLATVFMISLLSIFMISCEEENEVLQDQLVQFGFSVNDDGSTNGRVEDLTLTNIRITIKDAMGTVLYSNKSIPLYKFGNRYTTDPITFKPGTYTITNYIVEDTNSGMVYATPFEGSKYAYLVSDPLPINFTVVKDEINNVAPEVLLADNANPLDFGYAAFSVEEVEFFNIYVTAFALNNYNKYQLTDATLQIYARPMYGPLQLRSELNLQKRTNVIPISFAYRYYELKIIKPGYQDFTLTSGVYNLEEYSTEPLTVILEKI
ncbi:hypothetical protein LVD17_27010 [Fulvivirga ulvae]|uniref:hypothetical protein n=1 Tax=Fulvivirga ulvae TaxID=2904245 RepID=UPI001F4101C9|nr:hypothetical protein [Fulvivirga ulvae]UII31943.1 hypothetical protein LVD17_27010 [Fulvivirga ulvae]